jgi:hypothetical protein
MNQFQKHLLEIQTRLVVKKVVASTVARRTISGTLHLSTQESRRTPEKPLQPLRIDVLSLGPIGSITQPRL